MPHLRTIKSSAAAADYFAGKCSFPCILAFFLPIIHYHRLNKIEGGWINNCFVIALNIVLRNLSRVFTLLFCEKRNGVNFLEIIHAMDRNAHFLKPPKNPVFKPFFEGQRFIDGSNIGAFLSFTRNTQKIKSFNGVILSPCNRFSVTL